MINTEDQEQLFKLIADYLDDDLECIAIGGTAMMFSGYKNATKDIDLVFSSEKDRKVFVKAIESLGYRQKSLVFYDEKRRKFKNRPKIYSRGDERFDLFVKNVFGFEIRFGKELIVQRHDFIGKKELIVQVLPKEYLLLLKAITGREKDYEDIEAVMKIEKDMDWELIVEEAVRQRKNNSWILIDLEETMQKLKKKYFIKKKYFDRLYGEDK